MFRQLGGTVGITISTVIIQGMGDAGLAFTVVFAIWGIVMLATIPTIFAMPRHQGGLGLGRSHGYDT